VVALLTPEQAKERLSVGRSTIYQLIRTGQLRSVRFGRAIRVSESEIERFVREAEAQATEPEGET
jgi:excisionase family DNA binding protein